MMDSKETQGATPSEDVDVGKESHALTVADTKKPDMHPYAPFLGAESIVVYLFCFFLVWSFAWFYIGGLWDPLGHAHKTHHMVLNCDTIPNTSTLNSSFLPYLSTLTPEPLGDLYLDTTLYNSSSTFSTAYHWVPMGCPVTTGSNRCGTAEEELACLQWMNKRLKEEKAWGLLYIPSNFTTTALSWYYGSGVTPRGQKAQLQFRYATGRDYTGGSFILAHLRQDILAQARVQFMEALVERADPLYAVNPAFYAVGAYHLRYDVAPVKFFGQNFASYIFIMGMWLASAFVAGVSFQFKLPVEAAWLDPEYEPKPSKLELFKGVCLKASFALFAMFIFALLTTCTIWGLGKGDAQWYYNGGYCTAFLWYLSWSNLAMNAILIHAMGLDKFGSIMIFLMIFQFSTASAIVHVSLSSRFYRIGRMFPYYYGVRGLRTIFFGVMKNKMWVNWLVFTGYNVFVGVFALFFITKRIMDHGQRRKLRHEALAETNEQRLAAAAATASAESELSVLAVTSPTGPVLESCAELVASETATGRDAPTLLKKTPEGPGLDGMSTGLPGTVRS